MTAPQYKGELRKGDAPGTVVGVLLDKFQWKIHLHGTRNPDGSYTLTGTLGETPPALRIPMLDDAP